MSVWSYVCRACEGDDPASWHVAAAQVLEMPADVTVVRVKVGPEWRCAVVDRSAPVAVEQQLIREVIASSADDCPSCRDAQARPAAAAAPGGAARADVLRPTAPPEPVASSRVRAAAISVQGVKLVVALVSLDLVRSSGEADMAIETLVPGFGGAPVVLMAQQDDGTPVWHGKAELVELVRDIPLERLPWKQYAVD